jgi:hypothetical protein
METRAQIFELAEENNLEQCVVYDDEKMRGALLSFIDEREPNWAIEFLIFSDRVEISESEAKNSYSYETITSTSLSEALDSASQWC